MKTETKNKAYAYQALNEIAIKGEIVIFGSTYMANFPFYELINKSKLENAVYNRSIEGLTLDEAKELLSPCVFALKPSKIFLSLGEEDLDDPCSVEKYVSIVRKITATLPQTKLYLICIPNERAVRLNRAISNLCDGKKIVQIHFSTLPSSTPSASVYKTRFKELTCFFRDRPINYCDAFSLAF